MTTGFRALQTDSVLYKKKYRLVHDPLTSLSLTPQRQLVIYLTKNWAPLRALNCISKEMNRSFCPQRKMSNDDLIEIK
jgi:hypothetical protein